MGTSNPDRAPARIHNDIMPSKECESRSVGTSLFAPKLTDPQRHELVQQLATFRSVGEVQQFAKDEWGVDLAAQTIRGYLNERKWKPLIDRVRQEWAAGVVELRLAHKRGRIEELCQLYERTKQNETVSEFTRIMQSLSILREIRYETDEAKSQFTNVFMTQINEMTDEQLLKRRAELLQKISLWTPKKQNILVNRNESSSTT